MKVPFYKRLGAYFIDILIIGVIMSIVGYALPNNKDAEIEKEVSVLLDQYKAGEVESSEFVEKYISLAYESQKNNVTANVINIALTIAYFIIFQYMNKGQTLGKKLLKLKVVDNNTKKEIGILRGILRSIVILRIISGIYAVALIGVLNQKDYMNIYATITEIEYVLIITSAILVLYRKDGRGLHDIIANTTVIEEEV